MQVPLPVFTRAVSTVIACGMLVGCGTLPSFKNAEEYDYPSQHATDTPEWKDEEPRNYLVGADDVLDVLVHDHADISGTYTVRADGSMPFPLLGSVAARGKTVIAVAREISDALDKDYIVSPVVSVSVSEYRSQSVLVQGNVARPGTYYLKGNSRLLDVLSEAEGVTPLEGRMQRIISRVRIIRGSQDSEGRNGDVVMIRMFDLEAILEKGDVTANPILRDGDVIFLPEPTGVYVMGEAGRPQRVPFERDLTVLKAIVLAGGTTEYGTLRGLKIRRVREGIEISIRADVDSPLEPGDIVVVPRGLL